MSIEVISRVWRKYPGGGAKLLTMLALADWASDDGGNIFPSIKTLAYKIRMSERQTRRVLRELETEGFIKNLTPENVGGPGKSNRYQIEILTLSNCPGPKINPDKSDRNPDKSDRNSDIAMSDYTLNTLNTSVYPDKSDTPLHPDLKRQIEFLRSLKN